MTTSRQRSYRRMVISFLLLGFILQAAVIAVWSTGDLVFDDLHSPRRLPAPVGRAHLRGLFGALNDFGALARRRDDPDRLVVERAHRGKGGRMNERVTLAPPP